MPEWAPFRGWRFAVREGENLATFLAPPYDVVTPEERRRLVQRHPHNIVQVDLPEPPEGEDRYAFAAGLLREWQQKGVLIQEPSPVLYVLEQRFRLPTGELLVRRGIIGLLKLEPWGQGVYPHERTFPHAKRDRLALLEATRAEFSPVFLMFSDPERVVEAALTQGPVMTTLAVASTDEDVTRLCAITDDAIVQQVIGLLANRALYVADGHHRYETALNYQRQQHDAGRGPGPHDFVLAYAVAMEDPGLVVLPTHRCLHDVPNWDEARLLGQLEEHFHVTHYTPEAELLGELYANHQHDRVMGLVLAGRPGGYLLRWRHRAKSTELLLARNHPAVAQMDVALLQDLVLEPVLGIGAEPAAQRPYVAYEPKAQDAIEGVRAGRYQAAFLLRPTPLAQIKVVADAGQVAPPKATFFFPKLPSGLVIYDLDRS